MFDKVDKIRTIIEEGIEYKLFYEKEKILLRAMDTTLDYINANLADVRVVYHPKYIHAFAFPKANTKNKLILEFGVFSGKSINQISSMTNQKVYGFDSFKGLPDYWRIGHDVGSFARDDIPKVNENVELIIGWFDDTLDDFLSIHKEDVGFLHIDCDVYSSTKTIFNKLQDRIKSGCIICFDEYFNYPNWEEHEYRAFQEFINITGLKYKYICMNGWHEQVAVEIL